MPQIKYEAESLRDPFPPPPEKKETQKGGAQGEQQKTAKPVDVTPPVLTVQGLIWGAVIPQAVINGKVVKAGDTIEEAQITKIGKEGVEIVFKEQTFHLSPPSITQKGIPADNTKGGSP
jgi:hypothetical protein